MKNIFKHPSQQFLLNTLALVSLLILSLACGGGGGGSFQFLGGGGSSKTSVSLKGEAGADLPEGTTLTIAELGGEGAIIAEDININNGEADVTFSDNTTYVFVLKVDDLPYLRTVLSSDDVTAIQADPESNSIEFNAITTYLAGQLEIDLNGSQISKPRSKALSKTEADQAILDILAENFGINVTSFMSITHDMILNKQLSFTDVFVERITRINILRVYTELVEEDIEAVKEEEQIEVQTLYANFFDETTNNLNNSLQTVTLFTANSSTVSTIIINLEASNSLIAENDSATADENSEGVLDIQAILNDPATYTVLLTIDINGSLNGAIVGMQQEGVDVTITNNSGFQSNVLTDSEGNFSFSGLDPDNYQITVNYPGFIFDPQERSVTLAKAQSLVGVQFASLTDHGSVSVTPTSSSTSLGEGYYESVTIAGSSNLNAANIKKGLEIFGVTGTLESTGTDLSGFTFPEASEVSSGVSFSDAGGNTLNGTLELPNSGNVLSGTTYGNGLDGTATLPDANQVLSGVNYGDPNNQKTGTLAPTNTTVIETSYQQKTQGGGYTLRLD